MPDDTTVEALNTLVIDIGGSGLKATVLDVQGEPVHERVRVDTTYPCPPKKLVADLVRLVDALPPYQRVSAGFPGVVRGGLVITAPHFVTRHGPGSTVDDSLAKSWTRFDLRSALNAALGVPARVANDADVQGAGVVKGKGLELVLTFGTGLGSSVFRDGALALHLELAHHPAVKRGTYNDYVGDRVRKKLGVKHWNRRVRKTLIALEALIVPDTILVGGGNAQRIDVAKLQTKRPELATKVTLVGNDGGLLGGIRLWERVGLA